MSEEADLRDLARRYLDLWQDQMSVLAADEDFAEALNRFLEAMGLTGAKAADFLTLAGGRERGGEDGGQASGGRHGQMRREAGTAPIAAASDHGGPDLAELESRIAALDSRLAALEERPGAKRSGAKRPGENRPGEERSAPGDRGAPRRPRGGRS